MYAVPWSWFVPPRDVKLNRPPATWPNSAAKFEVWSVNSWIASTDGCTSSDTRASSPLDDSWPSKRMRKVPVGLPLTLIVFQPEMVAPGVSWTKESGLRTAPAPIEKLMGRSLIVLPEIVVDCSALSVFNIDASAATDTDWLDWPTWSTTSTRVVTAT